jgi:peptidyl-prolyl cis-trans isomerase D
MGVMNYLRERMGRIVAIVIGLSLFAFILGEVLRQGSTFFKGDQDELGNVSGEKISNKEFQDLLTQQEDQYKQQTGQLSLGAQFTTMIQDNLWNQQVNQIILNKEIDKLGLTVGDDEVASMVSGNNPDPQIVKYFGDPQTGKVDLNKLKNYENQVAAAKADDPMKQTWASFLKQLGTNKLAQKYISLSTGGLYVNSLDAKDDYQAKNKLVNFKYVTLDYASIPDSKVTLTDDDYQSYYDEHKYEFKNKQETRSFDYVTFNAAPSKEDSAAVKDQVDKLIPGFKSSTNDSLYVQETAETKTPFAFKKKGQLGDAKLDSVMFNAPIGFIYGPYFSNGAYKIAKLVDSRVGPDSVKARHILIPLGAGGLAKAQAKIDSIKKVIQGGKSFEEMAKMYSTDKSSAEKGGELGTFGRGAMMATFEDAAFNGKKGEMVTATTQYGVHLIDIEDQKGSSKVVKVAIVDKPVTASSKTQTIAYSKAQAFMAALVKGNFSAEAKKEGLAVKTANDVQPLAAALPGIDNARAVVRWVFKADKGDFGDQVFVSGDQYIIPVLTEIKPMGTLPLDAVKKQIEPAVRNKVKAKQLIAQLQSAESGASTLDQVAQKVHATVASVQNIVLANPVIPGLSVEYKVVGTIFGSKPNKLSQPIEGQHGVYVFSIDNFINAGSEANAVRQKDQIAQALSQRAQGSIFDALKDKANVKDYRSKFL